MEMNESMLLGLLSIIFILIVGISLFFGGISFDSIEETMKNLKVFFKDIIRNPFFIIFLILLLILLFNIFEKL